MLRLAALALCTGAATASYAHWQFGTAPAGTKWTSMETEFRYTVMDPSVYVFFSQQMWWGGSAGYFGTQHDAKKGFSVIFSMWDNKDVPNSARWPAEYDDVCERFGGEGEGSHCQVFLSEIRVNKTYNIRIYKKDVNATGTTWGFEFTDKETNSKKDCGALYYDEAMVGAPLDDLQASSAGFQEYFVGGSNPSALAWSGPTGTDANGVTYRPTSASCEADATQQLYCAGCDAALGCGPKDPVFVLSRGPVQNSSAVTWVDHGKLWEME